MDYESHSIKEMSKVTPGQVTVTDGIPSKCKAGRTPAWRWGCGDKIPALTEELLAWQLLHGGKPVSFKDVNPS